MQVLKNYVRTNILTSAKEEFLDKGYTKASMRGIAVNAGITVGNVYRYYESKENLFEAIVEPTFMQISNLFQDIQFDDFNTYEKKDYLQFRNEFTKQFMKIVIENKDEMFILIKCSEGTRYRSAQSHFSEIIEAKVNKYVVDVVNIKGSNYDKTMISRVISKNIVDGLTEVIIYNGLKDLKRLEKDVLMLMDLYFNNILTRFDF